MDAVSREVIPVYRLAGQEKFLTQDVSQIFQGSLREHGSGLIAGNLEVVGQPQNQTSLRDLQLSIGPGQAASGPKGLGAIKTATSTAVFSGSALTSLHQKLCGHLRGEGKQSADLGEEKSLVAVELAILIGFLAEDGEQGLRI
jgi:hypothetical protein